jgi:hypothetical protein
MPGPLRRARYSLAELLTAAFMAGAGNSGSEIAEVLSRETAAVSSMLRRLGLRLVPKVQGQVVVHAVLSKDSMEIVNAIARRRQLEPKAIVSAIVENALDGGTDASTAGGLARK